MCRGSGPPSVRSPCSRCTRRPAGERLGPGTSRAQEAPRQPTHWLVTHGGVAFTAAQRIWWWFRMHSDHPGDAAAVDGLRRRQTSQVLRHWQSPSIGVRRRSPVRTGDPAVRVGHAGGSGSVDGGERKALRWLLRPPRRPRSVTPVRCDRSATRPSELRDRRRPAARSCLIVAVVAGLLKKLPYWSSGSSCGRAASAGRHRTPTGTQGNGRGRRAGS